jgi:hypothetical protein
VLSSRAARTTCATRVKQKIAHSAMHVAKC